jgi:hypothetical protein
MLLPKHATTSLAVFVSPSPSHSLTSLRRRCPSTSENQAAAAACHHHRPFYFSINEEDIPAIAAMEFRSVACPIQSLISSADSCSFCFWLFYS